MAVRSELRMWGLRALAASILFLAFSSIDMIASAPAWSAPGRGLTAFRSDEEIKAFFRRREAEHAPPALVMPAPSPPMPAPAPPQSGNIVVTGTLMKTPAANAPSPVSVVNSADLRSAADPSITNNQVAGVDEGDIVKIRGNILVILRRGRLFTVSLAGGALRPVDAINAFPPDVSGRGDWYDEMLIAGDRIIVIGYSYARGGTEVNRFRLAPDGRLAWIDAYHFRSDDYYSDRNYASRLIGNRLILYAPLQLDASEPLANLPAMRPWRGRGSEKSPFRRIASARRIYMPPVMRDGREVDVEALHTVTTCDLAAPVLDCTATGVLGPDSRTFFVSSDAVYLWTSEGWRNDVKKPVGADGILYRLPLDGGRPAAVGVRGSPPDQFAFQEDPGEPVLNVLVRAEGGGDAMWRPEVTAGDAALVRIPAALFGNGRSEVPLSRYRPLPRLQGPSWNFHDRFIGGTLLYGGGEFARAPDRRGAELVAVPVHGGAPTILRLPHAVERIEALGNDGLVVGSGAASSLGFSGIELGRGGARLGDLFVLPAAEEGETRSHAFFFRPDADAPDGASGILGLPVARPVAPAYARLLGNGAAMLFLRRNQRRFAHAGEIAARAEGARDDACQASCVDWYGNARPIFLGDRTFALLGYELVEGRLENGRVREVRRVDFAPTR